jgi:hypothetical protein
MTYVMQHETWMKLTAVTGRVRGSELKSIDSALKQYHKTKSAADLKKLKLALHHWKMYKGFDGAAGKPAWRTSDRNRNKAVETLDMQIFGMPDTAASGVLSDLAELPFYGIEMWAEDEARAILRQAREQALSEMFQGRRVDFGKLAMVKTVYAINKARTKVQQGGTQAAVAAATVATAPAQEAAREAIMKMLQELLGQYVPEVAREVMALLAQEIPGLITDLAASMAPYVSICTAGTKAIWNTGWSIAKEYQWVMAKDHMASGAFASGDPIAAAHAIKRMIERERNQHMRLAAIYGQETAVKTAGVVADAAAWGAPTVSAVMTPLAGGISAFQRLALLIFLLARDVNERRKANKILTEPSRIKLGPEVFDKCPILGCYFISCSNTSDIVNMLTQDIGAVGWKLDIEVMKRHHIDPMIEYARHAIANSRLEVSGMTMHKGVVAETKGAIFATRWKNQVINGIKGALPFTDYAKLNDMSGSVSKDVLKSRITGQGSGGR